MTRTAFDELTRHAPGPTTDIETLFPDLTAQRTKRRVRRPAILVGAVAAVTATVLVVPVMMPGGATSAAALDNLSLVAGRQPEKTPVGILHLVFTERFDYQGDVKHESWTLADGTTWRRDTEADGSVAYMKLPPLYSELSPATVSALPTDPAALDQYVRSHATGSGSNNEAAFQYYGDALRQGYVPPAVRKAMIIAMKRLPFITTQSSTTFDGAPCMRVTYSELLRFFGGHYYCFDEGTARMVEDGITSFGTVTFRRTFTVADYVATVPADIVSRAIDYTGSTGGPSTAPSPTATPS